MKRKRKRIRIDLGNDAWVDGSPDIQRETVAALRRLAAAVWKQYGVPIMVHADGLGEAAQSGEIAGDSQQAIKRT